MDVAIIKYVQEHFHNRFTDHFFPLVSRIGNAGAIWFVFAFCLGYHRETRYVSFMMFFALALAHIISQILKPVIGRPRPFIRFPGRPLLIHTPGGYSCPSGHSATSFAAATVLFLYDRRLGFVVYCIAFLIAFSRIFVFVHYPSDTILGALLGVLCAIFILYLYRL